MNFSVTYFQTTTHTRMQVAIDNCNKPNLTDLRQLLNANSGTLVIPYNLDELFLLIPV